MRLLFSFKGRVSRGTLWGVHVSFPLTMLFLSIPFAAFPRTWVEIVTGILSLSFIWISIAVSAKRWHDCGRSGWWVLLYLVPIVNVLMFVYLGLVKGTPGPNKYGEDPLAALKSEPADVQQT
jgi:uncharacterized membrane protein YhaH (DUF805 family)